MTRCQAILIISFQFVHYIEQKAFAGIHRKEKVGLRK